MRTIDIFSREVFNKARKMPDIMSEPFFALEEYDRTRKLVDWRKKASAKTTNKKKEAANI